MYRDAGRLWPENTMAEQPDGGGGGGSSSGGGGMPVEHHGNASTGEVEGTNRILQAGTRADAPQTKRKHPKTAVIILVLHESLLRDQIRRRCGR